MSDGIISNSSRFTITKPFQQNKNAIKNDDVKLELLQNHGPLEHSKYYLVRAFL